MKPKKARIIKKTQNSQPWYQQRKIAEFMLNIDELPDAAAIKKQKQKCLPAIMVPMVF